MSRLLALVAYVCCGLVIASFALFAYDQVNGASEHQQTELASGATASPSAIPVIHHHGQPRAFIDGAASALTSPFRALVHSDSEWVMHLLPTLIALLFYGVGLGYLSRYSSGLSSTYRPSR
jgi:hypothetical protein